MRPGPVVTACRLWLKYLGGQQERQGWPRTQAGPWHSARGTCALEREAETGHPVRPPALGRTRTLPAAAAPQGAGRAASGTHPGTAPPCPAAHTRCRSPGGPGAAPSCPRPSRIAAACSGTASLGRGRSGHGGEEERLLAAWSHLSALLAPTAPHPKLESQTLMAPG